MLLLVVSFGISVDHPTRGSVGHLDAPLSPFGRRQVTIEEYSSQFNVPNKSFVQLLEDAIAKGWSSLRMSFTRHELYSLVTRAKKQVDALCLWCAPMMHLA